jgi:dihydrofolate synthase/folylpolyglutamate synthase
MRRGLEETRWAGRLETIRGGEPLIIVDGAHNPDAADTVKAFMKDYLRGRKIILVAAILKEKDYASIIQKLAEHADKVVLTQPVYNQKACPPETLLDALPDQTKCAGIFDDYRQAVDKAIELAGRDGAVVVSGSLYLVGDVKHYLHNNTNEE